MRLEIPEHKIRIHIQRERANQINRFKFEIILTVFINEQGIYFELKFKAIEKLQIQLTY